MHPEEESLDLIQQAQGGDPTAVDRLLRKHLPSLRAFIRMRTDPMLRLRESSVDVVQSACLEALQSLEGYEWQGEGSFRSWLFTLAMNKLKHKKRHLEADKRSPDREEQRVARDSDDAELADVYRSFASPSQHAMAHEVFENVEAALDRIPPQFREVIVLSRVIGLTHEEIGVQLGKNEGAVRMLLHRALARLTTAMTRVR